MRRAHTASCRRDRPTSGAPKKMFIFFFRQKNNRKGREREKEKKQHKAAFPLSYTPVRST